MSKNGAVTDSFPKQQLICKKVQWRCQQAIRVYTSKKVWDKVLSLEKALVTEGFCLQFDNLYKVDKLMKRQYCPKL